MFHLLVLNLILIFISSLMIFISILLNFKTYKSREKNSPFECGFDPNSSSRLPFSLRFFLITIIFLIFDVEIVLLLPGIISFSLTLDLTLTLLFFLFILMAGLLHEWNQGALNWAI